MFYAKFSRIKRIGKRAFRLALSAMMIFQTLWIPNSALATGSSFAFRGYGAENMSSSSLNYGTIDASVSGRDVTISPTASEGEAIGLVNLDEPESDITASVDLGGLEIDFSTISNISLEGENGTENDVPSVKILFCSEAEIGSVISSVTLTKQDSTIAGNETLSSGASIPSGTKSIFIRLKGKSISGNNTVTFSDTSLVIHDSGAPSCSASYNQNWTNQDVTVTINAADSDAGLEGIYSNNVRVSQTSPYTFTVSSNNTSFSVYAMDLAGKKSDVVTGTIDHIDKTTPAAPSSVPLSSSNWTNADVSILMPALTTSSGSPERYVYQIGTGAWTDLPEPFALSAEGSTTIRVAVADAAGNRSGSAQATAKIDKSKPTISSAVITSGSSTAKVDISATEVGSSGLAKFCYAAGEQTEEYFTTGGTSIVGSTFTVSVGGTYTIFASDNAGNTALKTISITTAPTFGEVANVTMDEDETKHVTLSIHDAESSLSDLLISVSTSDSALLKTIALNQTIDDVSLDITPAANLYGGPATITVEVEDPSGQKVSRTFSVTVLSKNDAPVAQNDTGIEVLEDGKVEVDVLANDGDEADNESVSISGVGEATHGKTLLVLDKIRYTPDENYWGTDSFTYEITDGKGGTAEATVFVTVTAVNDAPTAKDDTVLTAEDTAVSFDALANDSDIDAKTDIHETIALVSSTDGAHGTTEILEGLIVYTPEADYNGTDEFTYIMQDAAGLTAEASVHVIISPETDAPAFVGLELSYNIDEDAKNHEIAFAIRDVETAADSLMLQAATLDSEKLAQTGIVISGLGDSDPAVKLLLTPVANQNGDVSIKLTLGDGFETVEQTILIHINPVNDAPHATSYTKTLQEDEAYADISIASLLDHASDIDGDAVYFDGLASQPAVGEVAEQGADTLRYIPAKDFEGTTSFTYYISDGTARALATCYLEVTGVNDAPSMTVEAAVIEGIEDQQIVIPFEISDNESDPADLDVIVASSDNSIVNSDGIEIIKNADGTGEVHILPAADANGSPTITLTVSDGVAQANDSVVLHIAPAQDAPVAEEDLVYVHYTTSRTFSVLVNDHDVDGDELTITKVVEDLPGTLTLDNETQLFNYVPAIGETGTRTFTYTIDDGTSTSSALVTLDVVSETHAPVLTPVDSRYVSEDGTASGIGFSVSDEDAGDTFTVSVKSGNKTLLPEDGAHIQISNPSSGNYSLTLTPAEDRAGSVTVTITVTDSTGLTDSTSFTLHVIAQNDAPVANDDALSVDEDGALLLTMLANDTDADLDTIWLSSLSSATHGYIERSGNEYRYYPYDNWSGTETLSYRISDGRASAQASVTITVLPVNDAPIARDDWRAIENKTGHETTNINVIGNDYDVDTGDVVHAVQIVDGPDYGTATLEADGTITYTRNQVSELPNGADSFTYRIIDRASEEAGDYLSATATVHIGVVFKSSLYTYGEHVYCYEDDAPFTIDLSIENPTPVEYTLTVNSTTTLGTFEVVDNDTVRFSPAANQNGYAAITYTIEQVGGGEKDTGTIWLRVYPVNDLPEITYAPSAISMDEDTSEGETFDVFFHDADCANDYLYFYVYSQNGESTSPIPFLVSYSVNRTGTGAQVTVNSAENVNGTGEIIVGVSDGMTYAEKKIDLTIHPVDDAPVVSNIEKTIREDSSVTFASPGSDSEVDGDTIVESIDPDHAPQHGTATIRANRTIYYVPNANFYGVDEFKVIVSDDKTDGLFSVATVTITVNAVNDAPEITALDYYQSTLEDYAKDVPMIVVDVDNDMTSASRYTLTSGNESLVKNENITISSAGGNEMIIHVVPEANAYGTVKINIVANDGALSAKGAFSLNIIPVNDAPEAEDDSASVDEVISTGAEAKPPKTTATINLLNNDADVEDGKPSVVSISNIVNALSVANIGGGKVLVSADGDFSGTITFTYTVMDRAGATDSANVTLTVNAVNDPPRAKSDSFTINEDETPLFNVLGNDYDPEGNTLSIQSIGTSENSTAEISGTKIQYVPNQDFYGNDSFTYTVSDGLGGTATATVNVTIKPVNDAPTIAKHSSTSGEWKTLEDTPASFNFVVADAESAVNNLIIKLTSDDPALVKNTQIALSTNAAGYKTLRVTPQADVYGILNLKIWVSDGLLASEKVYPLEIISVNDAPVVTVPLLTTKEDTPLSASAFATDSDGDDVTFAVEDAPAHGIVSVNEDGTFDYTPTLDYNGTDSFVICADDGQPENNLGYATVYITVKPDGDAPVAADDSIEIDEDTPTEISVLANDKDEDVPYGDSIAILRAAAPAHGKAVIDGDIIRYTPNENYNGSDSFSYTISDQDGKTDTALVSITIRPVNDAPSGGDDTATVLEDHSVVINPTGNDDVDETTNPDDENVTILTVDNPGHGTATVSEDNKSITYTPNADWFSPEGEPELFYYTAKDAKGLTGRFAIRVTVTPVNDLPVISPDDLVDVTTAEDTQTGEITFTVRDVETAAGSLKVTATHLNGVLLPAITVTPDANGVCSFTVLPNANKVGSALITVKVTDADGGVDSDTFTLYVTEVNDAPRPGNDSFTVSENGTYKANVLANDDVDTQAGQGTDTLTLLSIATPQYGTATIVDNQLYYVPNANRDTKTDYFDVFTYTMKDSHDLECSPTVTVKVTPVNDAPKISVIADVTDVLEDAANGTGDISFTVTDEEDDDDTLTVSVACNNTALFPLSNITITNPTGDETGSLRSVKAIPAANKFGEAEITLTVRDSQTGTATSKFKVTVTSVNDEPDNGDRSFTVVEDVEKQLDILTGIDPDYATRPGDYTITTIKTQASHGTARVAADGKSLYYVTAQDSNEPDSFEYTVHDAYGDADYTFTVSITVTPVNDNPVVHYSGPASYTIFEGTQLDDIPFTVTDVDDVAFSGGAQTVDVFVSAKSSNSILLVNGIHIDTLEGYERNIDLKPYLRWNGSTRVTITAVDPDGAKGTAFFDLIVNNVNDVPVANDDSFTILEDETTSVDVLHNDTDADIQTNPDKEKILVNTVTDTDPNATIEKSADGLSVIVTPKANYNGPVSFTYTVIDKSDAVSNTATATITVQQVNDAPTPLDDSETTDEDTAVDIFALENDSDIDMQPDLNEDYRDAGISISLLGGTLVAPAHGTVTSNGAKITYTPNTNYNGTDSFQYFCFDGEERTRANVSVTIKQVNDTPIAVADTMTIDEDSTTGYVDVMANDTDVDLDETLNLGGALLRSLFNITSATLAVPEAGTVDVLNNKIRFTPALNWNGDAVINYTLDDGYTETSSTTFTVTVTPVNDLPVFTTPPSNLELLEDGVNGSFGIVVGDVETAKSDLVVTATKTDKATLVALTDVTLTKGANGAWTIGVNPKDNQNGTAKIELTVKDGNNATTTAEFTVVVTAVNDAPEADDKTINLVEDVAVQTYLKSALTRDVDSGTNGDVLTLSITTNASHGTALINGAGNITYVPNANYNGTDSFVYTVKDTLGLTDTGTFSINISQVNDPPVAVNDVETTPEDTAVDVFVLANDSDLDMRGDLNAHPELESISVSLTGGVLAAPAHGTISSNGLKITYTPSANYNGTDMFEYFCFDGDVRTKASVTVTITAVNDAPVAIDKQVAINEDAQTQTYQKSLLVSDVDAATNDDKLTLTITKGASFGTAEIDEDGNVTYVPNANYNGTDSFEYTVTDLLGATDTGTFDITIAQVNDAPVAGADEETTQEDTAVDILVLGNDTDTDKQPLINVHPELEILSVVIAGDDLKAPSHGAISTDGLKITYTPDDDYNGTDTFDYYCADGEALTMARVTVTITQVNDSPSTIFDYETIEEDGATEFIDVMANDTDVDLDETLNLGSLLLRSKFYLATAWLDDASQGSIQVVDNKVKFTPTTNWNGTAKIYYSLKDGYGGGGIGALFVTVEAINDVPVYNTPPTDLELLEDGVDGSFNIAVSDVETLKDDLIVSVTKTDNASLVALTDVKATKGENGAWTISVNPKDNQHGTAVIELTLDDGDGALVKETFTVEVAAVNDAPVALDKTLSILEDASKLTFEKAALTSDVDFTTNEEALTLTITKGALLGTAEIDEDGNVTYVPNANYNGTDSFEYTVTDMLGATDTGTFDITIAQVNDAPVAGADEETTEEDTAVDILVLGNDTDTDKTPVINAHPELEILSVVIEGDDLKAPSHGAISTDGLKITYTPDDDYNGTDTFDYYCADGEALTMARVTVTITQVNDSPRAVEDALTINEDSTTGYVDVMANDTDVDLDEALNQDDALLRSLFNITSATLANPEAGAVDVVGNKIKFTPAQDWFGEAVINYTLDDGYKAKSSTTFTVTVTSVNDLPYLTLAPGYMYLNEDGVDGVSTFGVADVETEARLVSVSVKSSDNTALVDLSDITLEHTGGGSRKVTVDPKDNQFGDALITLVLEDADGGKREVTFEVHVAAVNDAPVALDKTLNILEDASKLTFEKAALTSDIDFTTNEEALTLTITKGALLGTAEIDEDGNVTYVPNANYNGTDSFEYTVTDLLGATDTGTFDITIAQVNDAPLAGDDEETTQEDTAVDILVLENDSDLDMRGDLNVHPELESLSVVIEGSELTAPSHGAISTDGLKITYTPDDDYNGTDTFDYYCADGDTQTLATVTVTIKQVNDNPQANEDSTSTDEDKPVSYDVLANDTDVDTLADWNQDDLHDKSDFSIERCYLYGGDNGTAKVEGGSILYTPAENFKGTQIIKYVLLDGNGGTSTGTLTILVGSVNDPPVAQPDEMSAEEDNTASVNVLENDTDVDAGDTKTFAGFEESTSNLPGTITTDENGNISFTPDANYNGTFTLTYKVKDADGLIDVAELTVTITPVNDVPEANDENVSTTEDTQKQIDVSSLIGDVDIETNDDTISVTVAESGKPAYGTAQVEGSVITYTPDDDYNGSDEITYTVTDSKGASDTGTLSITVNAVNDPPVANDDAKTTQEDTMAEIFALANDTDIDTDDALNLTPADAPVISYVTNGAHGTATTDGQSIEYTPDDNYNGEDTITYTLSDGALTAEANVTITITQVNDTIEAADDAAETNDEDPVTIDVLDNDTDVDTTASLNEDALHLRNSFRITAVGTPEHGAATIVSGKIEYTPDDRFSGTDSFTYTVSDGHGTTASAKVTVTVLSVNDAPVILVVSSPKEGDRAGTGSKVTVEWTGFDIDGDALTYRLEYFDGKDWQLISNELTDTKYVFEIPDSLASTDGLKFRVNVRDSEFTSEYGYSGAIRVDKDAPKGTIVTMRTADGKLYTAGTWTNQTVTVLASSAVDASKVTYYYEMDTTSNKPAGNMGGVASAMATDAISRTAAAAPAIGGGAIESSTGMDVVTGVHTIYITAVDEYGNATFVGGYLARVDKQQPAVPVIRESISGANVLLSLTLQADPGNSGNDKLTLPDGTTVRATGTPTYAAAKNGTYNFTLTDVAGNRRAFTHTVSSADISKPVITISSGAYRIGSTTQDAISATLSFTDAESDIVSRGYQITSSSTFSGAYRAYEGALSLTDPGTYYIHAYAKNAFGLTANETFGPFIIEAVKAPVDVPTPTPAPTTGDVVIDKEDVEEIPGDTVKIRLPGKEWSETLTLEDVTPGTYLIEAMDENGNIRTVEVRVTMRDIIARSLRSGDSGTVAAIAAIAVLALALFLILFMAGHNITVVVNGKRGGSAKKMRTMRRIMFRKEELVIKLDEKQLAGGDYCDLKIAKTLSKSMRNNIVIVTMRGEVVLREQIPQDFNESFRRTIQIGR